MRRALWMPLAVSCVLAVGTKSAQAAVPTAEQALKLKPVQKDVDYDQPTAADIEGATVKAETIYGQTGWVVRDEAGKILRRFIDTDGDNVVDMWCYYRDGIEVYRDIDANHNGKADQSRWLNTAGTRWGDDRNEDGRIDSWRTISAEEATAEVVAALAGKDSARFARVLLSAEELKSLGVGPDLTKELTEALRSAATDFQKLAREQKLVTADTEWLSFGAVRPGAVPAGSEGSQADLIVYENVVAMVQTGNEPGQVQIGTLVQVGTAWRVVDAPRVLAAGSDEIAASGRFFNAILQNAPATTTASNTGAPDEQTQELLAELEELDKKQPGVAYSPERGKLLEKLAEVATTPEDRAQWLRQLADMLSAAAQSGEHPPAVEELQKLLDRLAKDKEPEEVVGYVKFRHMQAEYNLSFHGDNIDFAKIQTRWVENLEQYIGDYPKGPLTAEAMLQLAMAQEFAGQEDEALKWYGRIPADFPESDLSPKAAGAKRRLESVGKVLALQGQEIRNGRGLSLAQLKGKTVLIHYWATWCEPCKADMAQIKQLLAEYGNKNFVVVGISVDSDRQKLDAEIKRMRLPGNWYQLYEPGGIDASRLANELGIVSLPTMLLIDAKGRVANRSIHITELETELKKHVR